MIHIVFIFAFVVDYEITISQNYDVPSIRSSRVISVNRERRKGE